MRIRRAQEKDIETLLEWMTKFTHQVIPYAEPDSEHTRNIILDVMSKHVLLVAETDEGELAGMIGGAYMQHPLNPRVSVLQELAWWVEKKWRSAGVGEALLDAFAGLKKTDLTAMSLLPTSVGAEPVLLKKGFKRVETAYIKDNRS